MSGHVLVTHDRNAFYYITAAPPTHSIGKRKQEPLSGMLWLGNETPDASSAAAITSTT